jgi:hypothetical protein
MSLFRKVADAIGITAKPQDAWALLSDRERWRRAVVRNGNLGWEGKLIDRHAGGPVSPSASQRKHAERVREFLDRGGMSIEQRWNVDIPTLSPDQFGDDLSQTEQSAERRQRDDDPLRGPLAALTASFRRRRSRWSRSPSVFLIASNK